MLRLERALYAQERAQELIQSKRLAIRHEEARYSAFRKRIENFETRCQRLQDVIQELKADCALDLTSLKRFRI